MDALEKKLHLLKAGDVETRGQAIWDIRQIIKNAIKENRSQDLITPDLIKALIICLDDYEDDIRYDAEKVLCLLKDERTIVALIRCLEVADTPTDVRVSATGILAEMGCLALPHLRECLQKDDPYM